MNGGVATLPLYSAFAPAPKVLLKNNNADAGIRATTSATLPAQAVHVKEDLEHVIGDAAEVRMRAKGSNWSLAVHWREDPAEGLQQLEGVLSRHGLERPADLFTRPASLQDAYLAISDGLQR